MPFEPDEPVELRQIGRNTFRLVKPFAYLDNGSRYEISPEKVGETDLRLCRGSCGGSSPAMDVTHAPRLYTIS